MWQERFNLQDSLIRLKMLFGADKHKVLYDKAQYSAAQGEDE